LKSWIFPYEGGPVFAEKLYAQYFTGQDIPSIPLFAGAGLQPPPAEYTEELS